MEILLRTRTARTRRQTFWKSGMEILLSTRTARTQRRTFWKEILNGNFADRVLHAIGVELFGN